MATNEEILIPKALIVPQYASAAVKPAATAIGNIFLSGAKLCYCDGSIIQTITSA